MDLFDYSINKSKEIPFAERMRPRNLDEFFGQQHILAKGQLLRKLIEADKIPSMILQGPPATGKTSLALIISKMTKAEFVNLHAISVVVSKLNTIIDMAKDNLKFHGKKTIIFIDEIHILKSNVQMALLPVIEDGTVILIGATTENVSYKIIPPLLSRCNIYNLNLLTKSDINKVLTFALNDRERGFGEKEILINHNALEYLADICKGDIRSALNLLEIVVFNTDPGSIISLKTVQQACQQQFKGTTTPDFYDLISALIKSIRAGHSNAALYWLARMLNSGVDPLLIARRIVIQSAEDIGLANPTALQIAISAKEALEFIGMPEASIPLAEAVIYLCESPKSNSAYKAINNALNLINNTDPYEVPNQLKNSTGLYINPLENPKSKLEYLPKELEGTKLYTPQNSGIEQRIYQKHNPDQQSLDE
jgi:putative ATPase